MLSVITPVFNGERYIQECIKNVIDQNCQGCEHIIVDGASSDKTCDIIRSYASRFRHIRWISESDRGQSDAMNKGVRLSKGEILGFLNVDDYYESNVLNSVSNIFASRPEPSLIVGNCNIWGDCGKLIAINKPKNLSFLELLSNTAPFPVNSAAYFYHKSLHDKIGGYDVDLHYTMDADFLLKAVQVAKVSYFDETWGNFRLIQGTKTKTDIDCKLADSRFRATLRNHRKGLSVSQVGRLRLIQVKGAAVLTLRRLYWIAARKIKKM